MHAGYLLLDEMIFTLTATIEAALIVPHAAPSAVEEALHTSTTDVIVRLPLLKQLASMTIEMLYHPAW